MDSSLELAVCVGSVVNYTSLGETVSELWRVLKPGGMLIVEYERFRAVTGRSVAIVPNEVNYCGTRHVCWSYTDDYMIGTLFSFGFKLVAKREFHILSKLLVIAGVPSGLAALAAPFDRFVRDTRLVSVAANAILLCLKPS
jgi:hypothetical protein